jgi:hypothetical protein
MARTFLLLIAALASPAGAAEPLSAEAALASYRKAFAPVAEIDCPKARGPDEIVVCGRPGATDPNRLPLRIAPIPGERIPGEPMSAVAAMGARETCSTVGPNQNCGGGLPVIPIIMTAAKIAVKLIEGRD